MLRIERLEKILQELKKNGYVKINSLAEKLKVSPMTIRRDLNILEKKGIVYKTHGGAFLHQSLSKEITYDSKKKTNIEEKQKIAKKALEFISNDLTVFLDAGTTTYELAKLLTEFENLTVFTSDLNIALFLSKSKNKVFMFGGEIQKETGSVLGSLALDFVKSLHFDIAFLGTSAVNRKWQVVTPTPEKGLLKKQIINNSRKTILLADSTKFFIESLYSICSLEDLDAVITGKTFSQEEYNEIINLPINLIKV
ncbi:MAG: DeoR family transcriptional regulator, fructose operon transcriptional repressor [Petrotoga sp.]|nr:DeoR family transcriptional regulator, fructose operon transcriptional repressor [Petrotoga sp.]